jgi:hypothetical protein
MIMYVVAATHDKCPKCGQKMWLLSPASPTTLTIATVMPAFTICDDDFSHCGYIQQVGVGPVERK